MICHQSHDNHSFFYSIDLEKRIPQDHLLHKIKEKIAFTFICAEGKDGYDGKGLRLLSDHERRKGG